MARTVDTIAGLPASRTVVPAIAGSRGSAADRTETGRQPYVHLRAYPVIDPRADRVTPEP
ncbi:hypothetical protein [Streptomyces sp. BE133]|uniref:hypothetical protein n=1 Tax=Streptomyces sp. BE133 TaxID=3002523 RepID=UPI002E781192|nr:hypothetical protein [Streptomyces sp. BE133]MEE1808548.1 hypothetical protein [Streptomyces sp. BE133]